MTTDYIILRSPDYRAANRVVNNAVVIAASDDPEEIAAALRDWQETMQAEMEYAGRFGL